MSGRRSPGDTDRMVSLKVDNLTYRTRKEDLKDAFERYGEIGDVYIPRDPYSKDSLGYAFVRFFDKRDAVDALESMDGATVDGRQIKVQMARYGRRRGSFGGRGGRYGRRSPSPYHSGRSGRRSRSRRRSPITGSVYNQDSSRRHDTEDGGHKYQDTSYSESRRHAGRHRSFSSERQYSRKQKSVDEEERNGGAIEDVDARNPSMLSDRNAGNESRDGSIAGSRHRSDRSSSIPYDDSSAVDQL